MKKIYMYLLDTMADWEHGYLLQGLTLQSMLPEQKYQLCTVALSRRPIRTAGGMILTPDVTLDELDENAIAALVLLGADTWIDKQQERILDLASLLLEKGVLVAAICGATLGLAKMGLLDTRLHTSNAPYFLAEMASNYKGTEFYKDDIAVCNGNLITASSAGSLLWAKYILKQLNLYSDATLEAWYDYFSTGDAAFFSKLMGSFQT